MVAALLCLGFWQFGHGAYIPAKAWLAQELMQRAWDRSSAGEERVAPWPWADTWPVARLLLPDHETDLIVLEGASGSTMAFAPGHLNGTARPGGEDTCVISGHRDTHFAVLERIESGHLIVVEDPNGGVFEYRVDATGVVHEGDVAAVTQAGVNRVALVTCWPFDDLDSGGELRYVVWATLVGPTKRFSTETT